MLNVVKNAFNKLDKHCNSFLNVYLIINIIWIFLGMFLRNYFRFSYHDYSASYVLILVLNVLMIFYFNIRKLFKLDKIDIFLILLVIFGIIATIFAKDISISLYGYWKRYEGMFQLFYYYSLMYLSSIISNDKNKNTIINFILVFGLTNALVCILQVLDILKFIPINGRGLTHGCGLITHSNFFGSYMVLCLGLSIGKYLYEDDNKTKNIINLILFLCFYTAMLLSNTLSTVVGLFSIYLCIIAYLIYSCINKKINKFDIVRHIALLILSCIISILFTYSNKTVLHKDAIKLSNETKEIAKGNFDDSYGTSRMFIWKNTLKIVPKNLLHGAGIDNFYNAFGEKPLFKQKRKSIIYFDKAHNEYLQKLVCEGIFSCLTYLTMLFVIFIISIKKILKSKNYITIALFLAFVGYCIQAFFNISVIEIAPLFWIVCGLLYDRKCKVK